VFTVTVESMVSNRTREPLVSFYWPKDREAFQATPAEARAFAARVLECAEAAIGDSFLMRFGLETLGLEEAAAAAVGVRVPEMAPGRQGGRRGLAAGGAAMSELSGRQHSIVDFIRRFRDSHAYGPTIREIRDGLGLCSTSVAMYNLHELRRLGLVRWVDGQARTLEVVRQVASHPACPACHNGDLFNVLVPSLVPYEWERGIGWTRGDEDRDLPCEGAIDGRPYQLTCQGCGKTFECLPWS